jgi:hypothetical protein
MNKDLEVLLKGDFLVNNKYTVEIGGTASAVQKKLFI